MLLQLKSYLKSRLSRKSINRLWTLRRFLGSLPYRGLRFECPICGGRFRKFFTTGVPPRKNAICPQCGSFERHRLLWMFGHEKTNLFRSDLTLLHFAPASCLQKRFEQFPHLVYISADISAPNVMVKMDITAISLADHSIDCILCYHVLEHILDDRMALKELFRVLKPGGWAILQVPIEGEHTFEDTSIITAEERLKYFGQEDHVRIYGRDYKERLEESGFSVEVVPYLRNMSERLIDYYRLAPDNDTKEDIYVCTKSSVV